MSATNLPPQPTAAQSSSKFSWFGALFGSPDFHFPQLSVRASPDSHTQVPSVLRSVSPIQYSLYASLRRPPSPSEVHWITFKEEEKKGLYVLLSRSQAGPGRNFSQPRTNLFSLSVYISLLKILPYPQNPYQPCLPPHCDISQEPLHRLLNMRCGKHKGHHQCLSN